LTVIPSSGVNGECYDVLLRPRWLSC